MSRAIAPIDFALVANGAHWLIDEPRLSPQATTTLRQLAGFAAKIATAEPFGLTCLSAMPPGELLSTPDNPATDKPIQMLDFERSGALSFRLAALRAVQRLPAEPGDYQAIAAAVRARHRPGGLTLVVHEHRRRRPAPLPAAAARSRQLHAAARPLPRHRTSRPADRRPRRARIGRIVVTTQVVEAGLDLDATVLVTEAASWPSLIQRAGLCNRGGRDNADAEVWWLPPPNPFPYQQAGHRRGGARTRPPRRRPAQHHRRPDGTRCPAQPRPDHGSSVAPTSTPLLRHLTPDPSGNDVDIAPLPARRRRP